MRKIYVEMLQILKKRLDLADDVFLQMSELIVTEMGKKHFSAEGMLRLKALDQRHCSVLADVLEGITAVYHGRVQMFPVREESGLIEKMEKRNAQAEELERIVNDLLKEAGQDDRKNKKTSRKYS